MITNLPESRFQNLSECPACNGVERQLLFPIENTTVQKCTHCHMKFLDPCFNPEAMIQVYESVETLKAMHSHHEGYYDYGDVDTPSQTRAEFTTALEKLEKLREPQTSNSIFDVGYGNGFFLALAKKRGWTVDGIDSSDVNKNKAKSRYGLNLSAGSFHNFSTGTQKYDAVSFWDVIEHLPEPDIFLSKAKSLLKPGGILLVGVPNDKSLMSYIASILYRLSFKKFSFGIKKLYFLEHVSYFHLEALKTLADRNGFQYQAHFYSSTDLNKFKLPWADKIISTILLFLGKITGMQNRLVSFYTVKS